MMTNTLSSFLLCVSFLSGNLTAATTKNTHVIRAAIDIGMGGPKLQIAEVNLATNKITKILHTHKYFVNFYGSISQSPEKLLSSDVMMKGLVAFKDAINIAKNFNACGAVAIGTASFRSASNGTEFANLVQEETGIKIHIIDQDLEGKLAFQAVLSQVDVDAENLVVWDIGGGSIQFIAIDADGSYLIECFDEGAGAFNDYIISEIQHSNVEETKTPNPMCASDIVQAETYAINLSKKTSKIFKDKICRPTTQVVGAGNVFGCGIATMMLGRNPFSFRDIFVVASDLAGKTDFDLGGGDFAYCEGTNTILTLGFMRGLSIQQMHIVKVNNADGALIYNSFWE